MQVPPLWELDVTLKTNKCTSAKVLKGHVIQKNQVMEVII